jgi:hypothetical protein
MPIVQILDDTKYAKALELLLYRVGGAYQTRPFHKLLIGPGQYRALVEAGLVEPDGKEAGARGPKKKKQA